MTLDEKLAALRQEMAGQKIDAYVVGSADPHQSEYVASRYQSRAWLSGFAGSAGTLVVARDSAGLWVDSRYWLEAERVLKGSPITVFRQGLPDVPSMSEWLVRVLDAGCLVSYDAACTSLASHRELEEVLVRRRIRLEGGPDLLAGIWHDRPDRPDRPVVAFQPEWAAASTKEHLDRLGIWLQEQGLHWFLISALDEIAWLLNLRGSDVSYNPVFQAWLLAGVRGHTLFIDETRLPQAEIERLAACNISLSPYDTLDAFLQTLPAEDQILLPPSTSSMAALGSAAHMFRCHQPSPVALWKSVKTAGEQAALRRCMQRDGVALVKAFAWLDKQVAAKASLDEFRFGEVVAEFRAKGQGFRGESFSPIVGFGPNAAIVHYSAPVIGSQALQGRGVLLVDTGGQYDEGTTDITRTLLVGGDAKPEEKRAYTLVLKGHVRLAMARFPVGTNGTQLDTFARQPLWSLGLNYGHGTGHGVGFYLNVHEGPQRIAPSLAAAGFPLLAGNLQSNEPGFYLGGQFGIRIENLVLVQEDPEFSGFLCFETLSLCPYEPALVDAGLLDEAEKAWINTYHDQVWTALHHDLSKDEQKWLKERTKAL